MYLYSGIVSWYDDDTEREDTVIGFAKDLNQFVQHIDQEFSDIDKVSIQCINCIATDNQLLYIPAKLVELITEENDY